MYDPDNKKWDVVGTKVAQALVTLNSVYLGPWLDALQPVRGKLKAPLVSIFRDSRPESEHAQATNILADYANDDVSLIADLLMDADQKSYGAFFRIAQTMRRKSYHCSSRRSPKNQRYPIRTRT